jgi:hypothetical protein
MSSPLNEQLLDQERQRGYVCRVGKDYCSASKTSGNVPSGTPGSTTNITHRTTTEIVDGKATTDVYIFRQGTFFGLPIEQGRWIKAATTTDGGKTYTFSNEKDSKGNPLVGDGVRQSLSGNGSMNQGVKAQINATLKSGGAQGLANPPKLTNTQIQETGAVNNNTATNPEESSNGDNKPPISEEEFNQENVFKENTRLNYGDVKYPLNLSTTHQDCIKFTILEYLPPGLGSKGGGSEQSRIVTLDKGNPTIGARKPLGTVTLPIPAGINDSNTVNWADDAMVELQKIFADIASSFMQDGVKGATDAAGNAINRGQSDPTAGEQTIIGRFTNAAVDSASAQQRKFGSIENPNLELLFDGPNLRDFTFNFRFTPRSVPEAKNVKRIIRTFKQSMSAKRSKSSLLLKSPHTFAISYVTSDKQHPYLNKFKECALTGCSVNYTPDGTYMTYGIGEDINSRSMTAYEMQLTFKELEPLFDDEYGVNDFSNVGF